ncbi:MAG: hypothetical protein H7Y05_13845, partial [Steroidobacteraceae bacterium]|nr:hypothetical protein [Deltaproteobacteria bacterium]
MRRSHIKLTLKIAAFAIAGGMLLLLVGLIFLPALVSSHAAQIRIRQALSSSLKRQVAWSSLVMTWSDGLTLSGLKLGDGPAPLLKTDIDQIIFVPSVARGADGRFGIDLAVRIQNVRAELAPGPEKPPPPTKDPLTLLAESIQRIQQLDLPLPVDLRVMIEAAPLQVVYQTPAPGKQLRLQDFSFRLAMPSLADRPVTAELNGRVAVDGREMGKVSFNAKVSDLVTKERRVRLTSALFAVDAAAPGTSIKLSGGLSQADGFVARWKLDLPGLLAVAQPFIPPAVPKLKGSIELLLRAKTDTQRDLQAVLTIDGSGLAASGGALKAKRIGPLDVKLLQQIATDHVSQRVEFKGGTLAIPSLLNTAWSASVHRPSDPKRSLEFRFGPLRLDLARALPLAAPFLPPNAPVQDLAGEAFLRSLSINLNGPKNNGDLALAGFGIRLPHVRLALKKGTLTADDFELLLEKAACPLNAKLPTRLTADLLWSFRRTVLSGPQPLTLQGVRGKAGLTVNDLNLKSASPRKLAASAVLTHTFDLERASLGTQASIEKVHAQLRFLARAAESGDIEATLPEFVVTAASLQAMLSGKRVAPLPLSASLTATGLRLPADKAGRPTLQRATALISVGDFLRVTAEAALSAASPRRATSIGTARFDLQRVMPFAAPFVPSGLKADGVVNAAWNLAAPLPEKALTTEKQPLRSARAGLALFDKFELGVKLDNISATVPSDKGAIKVTGARSRPDLRIVSTKKGASARLEGGLLFSGVSGLPGAAGKFPSRQGSFAFNGELSDWREFRLNEELRIDALALSHKAELNVSRIDALLDEKQPFSTATLIKRLDANLFATVEGAFSPELRPLLPGIDVAGNINGSARVELSAGRELALHGSLKTKEFGVQLANGTRVAGLRSDIAINRVYALAAAQGERWTPLSTTLVRPAAVVTANPGAAEIVGRIHDDLRGDLHGSRSFSIRSVRTKASGGPLELTALEGDLLFSQEKSGLSFFQADLLGGTLLASGVFDLRPEVPMIAASGSFSNLDVTRLLSKEARQRQAGQDAEITGEMSLTAPLTAEQRELFEQLRLVLNLRKIGADTI